MRLFMLMLLCALLIGCKDIVAKPFTEADRKFLPILRTIDKDHKEVVLSQESIPPFRGRVPLEACGSCEASVECQTWTSDYSSHCGKCNVTSFYPSSMRFVELKIDAVEDYRWQEAED